MTMAADRTLQSMAKISDQRSNATGFGSGKTVLVVDDEPVVRDLLQRTLMREGFNVVSAADGIEGLERLASDRIDIVITDLAMPRMDGRELRDKAKEDHPEVPVIFITGQSYNADSKQAQKPDAELFIAKPFKNQDIRLALQLVMLRLQKARNKDKTT